MERRRARFGAGWLGVLVAFVAGGVASACGSSSGGSSLGDTTYGGGDDSGANGGDATTGTTKDGSGDDEDASSDAGASDDGSATSDASVDAGRDYGTDPSAFYGASRCASAGVLLCDGFENGAIDTSTWTPSNSPTGVAPSIDGTHAARGTGALHVMLNGAYGSSRITESKTFPAPNNRYFGRVFAFFHQLPRAPLTYAHWTFAAGTGTDIPTEVRLSGQFNQDGSNMVSYFGVGTDETGIDGGTGDWTTDDMDAMDGGSGGPSAVPTDQWVCIEWMNDGSANETRFWWDGVEHPSMHTTSTMNGGNGNPYILPTFTQQWIGFDEYQTTNETFEAWLDEVAIDTTRIGCVL